MKTLADLKRRLTVGTKLTLVFHGGTFHKYLNTTRAIEKMQTKSFRFEGGSWLAFPKASDLVINDVNTFSILEDGKTLLTYIIEGA